MAQERYHVLLFGDQTDKVTGVIDELYAAAAERSMILPSFLPVASDFCRICIGSVQPYLREGIPPFQNLQELSENHAKTDGSPVLASCALSYFARLGMLIFQAERDPTLLSGPRVSIGLCTNLFPAALAATAKSAPELARISLEGFLSYFTWVVLNYAQSRQIERAHGNWSYLVKNWESQAMQEVLDKFHKDHDIPKHKSTWIGVVGHDWITVSGPPSTLKLLIAKCSAREDLYFLPLPVASAVHAPHLPALDFDANLVPSYIWDLPIQENARIMLTEYGVPRGAKTLREATRHILAAIVNEPLMVRNTFVSTADHLKAVGSTTASVYVLGPSAHAQPLVRTLERSMISVNVISGLNYNGMTPWSHSSPVVAIVGMSARLPQANDLDEFWELMMAGRTTHERIPHHRFNLDDFYDSTGTQTNTMMNTDGCFLSDPGGFDTRLFNMSPREAMQVDPTHRLLLMTSYEALEKAGYCPGAEANLPGRGKRTGVYFGQNADVWREISADQGIDAFTAPGILRAFSPGRVSHHFGFEGPSYSVDSACSSSATALVAGECDMALVGGAQVLGSPFEFSALGKSGFLAPSGGCKTFRADADGYCRGEAVGVLVLKRIDNALNDNDRIIALIEGWGRNHSGDASSMTRPHPETQERLIREVLRRSNTKLADICYVELHGTGTIVGDEAEMTLITRLFGGRAETDSPIHIGSIKANVGHSESAAGVCSVIKAALMLNMGMIPPQAMITPDTELNPRFANFDMSSVRIDAEPTELPSNKRNILVNSFDAATRWHVVTVSAHSSKSLQGSKERLLEYLIRHPDTNISNIAYSTAGRRVHYAWRNAYVAQSTDTLIALLKKEVYHPREIARSISMVKPKVVFMFGGQGGISDPVVRELSVSHPHFRVYLRSLQELCEKLCPNMSCSITGILTGGVPPLNHFPVIEIQLSLFCLHLAMAELWKWWGVEPDIVLGHSFGEYAGLVVAGVLSVADAMFLVAQRARLFEKTYKKDEYGMLSLLAAEDVVQALLRNCGLNKRCQIACFNSPTCHVVGGTRADLNELHAYAGTKEITGHILDMPNAVHCEPIEKIREEIEEVAKKLTFLPPHIPVASTMTGEVVTQEGTFNAKYIAKHACQPVFFMEAMKFVRKFMAKEPVSPLWFEVGKGSTCLSFARETLGLSPLCALQATAMPDNWMNLSDSLAKAYIAGLSIDWPAFHRPYSRALRPLDLPTYAFDLKTYWKRYTTATAASNGAWMGLGQQKEHTFVPTATVQEIGRHEVGSEKIKVTFISSLGDSRLWDAIKGHNMKASVFVLVAWNESRRLSTLRCLELSNPFVLRHGSERQMFEIRVTAEKEHKWMAKVSFYSRTGDGGIEEHGSCEVLTDEYDAMKNGLEWDHIDQMRTHGALIMDTKDNHEAHIDHLRRRIFYKLYSTVVKYDNRYQGIVEAFIRETSERSDLYEAVAEVKLTATPEDEADAFTLNPYHSDSLVHIGGFVLNIKLPENDTDVYFSSGIGSITLLEDLKEESTYRTYIHTLNALEGESTVNIYVFHEDLIVAVVTGLGFRKLSRNALKNLLWAQKTRETSTKSEPSTAHATPPVTRLQQASRRGSLADAFISALIAEAGISRGDIEDNTRLAELGMDSLMATAIVRKMEEDTGQRLPVSMIAELQTVQDVRERPGASNNKTPAQTAPRQNNKSTKSTTPTTNRSVIATGRVESGDDQQQATIPRSLTTGLTAGYTSRAVLLHGSADPTKRPLILVAGATGSARTYAGLPALGSSTPIWVLESPFLHRPREMAGRGGGRFCTPRDLAPVYAAAVRGIRPAGPYLLGGYSAGAAYAYEVARLLLAEEDGEGGGGGEGGGKGDGENVVEKLVLIDMKAHRPGESWERAPRMEDVEALDLAGPGAGDRGSRNIGNNNDSNNKNGGGGAGAGGGVGSLVSGEISEARRLEHEWLFANPRCVYGWKPVPMRPDRRPRGGTVIIWARWGPFQLRSLPRGAGPRPDGRENPMAAENRDYMSWFRAARHTYDANGWDVLVGGDVRTHVVDGDHWSMLCQPCAAEIAELIDRAITE